MTENPRPEGPDDAETPAAGPADSAGEQRDDFAELDEANEAADAKLADAELADAGEGYDRAEAVIDSVSHLAAAVFERVFEGVGGEAIEAVLKGAITGVVEAVDNLAGVEDGLKMGLETLGRGVAFLGQGLEALGRGEGGVWDADPYDDGEVTR